MSENSLSGDIHGLNTNATSLKFRLHYFNRTENTNATTFHWWVVRGVAGLHGNRNKVPDLHQVQESIRVSTLKFNHFASGIGIAC